MRDIWYADNRDLVKWSVLLRLAEMHQAIYVLQIAYFRPAEFNSIEIDSKTYDIPKEVTDHFRNIQNSERIKSNVRVHVFGEIFEDRGTYLRSIIEYMSSFEKERCVVFLDPDTGLQPRKPNYNHVLDVEAKAIWEAIKKGDVFVLYQHQTTKSAQPWVEPKKVQLETCIGVPEGSMKIARGNSIARDVVFYFMQKA